MQSPSVYTLKNGLKICFLENKETESVSVHLKGFAGSNFEKVTKDKSDTQVGAAHICEHTFLNREDKSFNDLRNTITYSGGKIFGVTSRDDVLFMIKGLKGSLYNIIEFYNYAFKSFNPSKKDIQNQRILIQQEITANEKKLSRILNKYAYQMLFPETRMALPNTGDTNDVNNISVDAIKDFVLNFYKISNFVLVISGNFILERTVDKCKEIFESELLEDSPSKTPENILEYDKTIKFSLYNNPIFKQAHIKIDYPGDVVSNSNRYILNFLSYLYRSFLSSNLKKNKINFYNTDCTHFSSGTFGIFSIYTQLEKEQIFDYLHAYNDLNKNLVKLISSNQIVFDVCKNNYIADLVFDFEKNSARAEYYSNLLLHGNEKEDHVYEINSIKNIEMEAVKSRAEELLKEDPKITIVSDGSTKIELEKCYEILS